MTGNFGTLFATEPAPGLIMKQVKWDANAIRFHSPAEHVIIDQTYDLEMQIYHKVSPFFLTNLLIGYI